MKIYSDYITEADVRKAFATARERGCDIHIEDVSTWKPRHHAYGTEVHGSSVHGTRYANSGTSVRGFRVRAASWDDWGWVIAELYNMDENAVISIYKNEADFVATVRRYQPRGAKLAFLGALRNINEHGGYHEQDLPDRE